jgi:hypothetical protein
LAYSVLGNFFDEFVIPAQNGLPEVLEVLIDGLLLRVRQDEIVDLSSLLPDVSVNWLNRVQFGNHSLPGFAV